jgi:hypothetical protein
LLSLPLYSLHFSHFLTLMMLQIRSSLLLFLS